MTALIICPIGKEITYHPAYDANNHWRFTNKLERRYETLAVVYNNFIPEQNSYDHIIRMPGHKWQIIKHLVNEKMFNFDSYTYIGCVDDDLVTDIQSFNYGINLAEFFNALITKKQTQEFALWQLSMIAGSGIIYDCLKQNNEWIFSATNFLEMGSPFFRNDIFFKVIDFLNELDFTIGWGIDKMFCDVLQCNANVVHRHSIYHPPFTIKPSYYEQSEAMLEMNHMIQNVYPRIMREKYHRENWHFHDTQYTIEAFYDNIGR